MFVESLFWMDRQVGLYPEGTPGRKISTFYHRLKILQQQLEHSCLASSQSQTCSPSKHLVVGTMCSKEISLPPSRKLQQSLQKQPGVLNYSCLFITDLQPVQYKTYSSISPLHKYLLTIYYIYKMLCSKFQKLV